MFIWSLGPCLLGARNSSVLVRAPSVSIIPTLDLTHVNGTYFVVQNYINTNLLWGLKYISNTYLGT